MVVTWPVVWWMAPWKSFESLRNELLEQILFDQKQVNFTKHFMELMDFTDIEE
jgi:hypothetical protein